METGKLVAEIENKLKELLEEVAFLRAQVKKLEDENRELWLRLGGEPGKTGGATLAELYAEGRHICPAEYGRLRQRHQECLFCLHMLAKSRSDDTGRS